ncbi:hypothetical protein N8987_06400 [Crocinitomix sp.]|nr:hypothetical protein [Crocinitomix sp.]
MDKKAIRKEVKNKILKGLDKDELTFFSFTAEEIASLEWEHKEEFEYQGMMFDVVERKQVGSKIHFWCWQDAKESAANKALDLLIAKLMANTSENEKEDGITRLLSNLYFHYYAECYVHVYDIDLEAKANYYVELQSNFATSPPVPPPQFY